MDLRKSKITVVFASQLACWYAKPSDIITSTFPLQKECFMLVVWFKLTACYTYDNQICRSVLEISQPYRQEYVCKSLFIINQWAMHNIVWGCSVQDGWTARNALWDNNVCTGVQAFDYASHVLMYLILHKCCTKIVHCAYELNPYVADLDIEQVYLEVVCKGFHFILAILGQSAIHLK